MKRSLKFKRMAIRSAMISTAWFFTTIAFGSLSYAYESGGLGGLAFFSLCASFFQMAEAMNKFRKARIEREAENRKAVRYINQQPIRL